MVIPNITVVYCCFHLEKNRVFLLLITMVSCTELQNTVRKKLCTLSWWTQVLSSCSPTGHVQDVNLQHWMGACNFILALPYSLHVFQSLISWDNPSTIFTSQLKVDQCLYQLCSWHSPQDFFFKQNSKLPRRWSFRHYIHFKHYTLYRLLQNVPLPGYNILK